MDCSAIVNNQLSALELAITPNMGHGWASDVALSNIHERYLFTSLFHFILEHTSKYGFTIRMHLSPTSKLGYLSLTLLLYRHISGEV